MAAAELDEPSRAGVATRLRHLLDRWSLSSDARNGDAVATGSLEAASTAEIFAFIDNELGRRSG